MTDPAVSLQKVIVGTEVSFSRQSDHDDPDAVRSITHGAGSESWSDIQHRTFVAWVNKKLEEREIEISRLDKDLATGVALANLLEVLMETKLRFCKKPKMRIQYLSNIEVVLTKIQKETEIKLVNIGASDIVDGNPTACLGLIWELISKYSSVCNKTDLIEWLRSRVGVATKYGIDMNNYRAELASGRLACAMVDSASPGIINMKKLPAAPIAKASLAYDKGKEIGLPMLLTPQDMINPNLDDLSLTTFLASVQGQYDHVMANAPRMSKKKLVITVSAPFVLSTKAENDLTGAAFVPEGGRIPSGEHFTVDICWGDKSVLPQPLTIR